MPMYSGEPSPLARIQQNQLQRLYTQLEAAYQHQSRSSGVDRVRAQEDIDQLLAEIHELETRLLETERVTMSLRSAAVSTPNIIDAGPDVVRDKTSCLLDSEAESAHLVVAVFWQERSSQKIRVQPKLCYRDRKSGEVKENSLAPDDCSLYLKDFPAFLNNLVGFTLQKLSSLLGEGEVVWTLIIDLFVPLDLIKRPLSVWRDSTSMLLKSRPIVMGCSDRFDPSQPGLSVELRNQMKQGWQRFQKCVPEGSATTLDLLDWLDSQDAEKANFDSYSGFKCFGDWLLPEDVYLDRWQELILSGIPLALWWCEGNSARAQIESVFNALIRNTCFDFLREIPKVRDVQQKTCQGCVGVFYENPAYAPDVPAVRMEEQFFSWPGA